MNPNVSQQNGGKGSHMLLIFPAVSAVLSVVFCVLALKTNLFMPRAEPVTTNLILYEGPKPHIAL